MAWDINRPVQWDRLVREWLIYAGIMALVLLVVLRDDGIVGALAGLLISGPLYLGIGWVLAKFGYQRKTFKEMRGEKAAKEAPAESASAGPIDASERARPAPTKRTSTGYNRPTSKQKRR